MNFSDHASEYEWETTLTDHGLHQSETDADCDCAPVMLAAYQYLIFHYDDGLSVLVRNLHKNMTIY